MKPPPTAVRTTGKATPKAAAKAKPKAKDEALAAKRGPGDASASGKSVRKVDTLANAGAPAQPASQLIDQRIRDLGGWRGETLARMRALILEAEPQAIEECKWVKATNPLGVPVWSRGGIICTGEAYAKAVKLTFARGASLPDPSRLFNASLEGNTRRAIDIREGDELDANAFKALVRAASAQNGADAKKR